MKLFVTFLFTFFVLLPLALFAQEVVEALPPPSGEEIMAFLASLGGLKGASSMVIGAAVAQGLMLLVKAKASLTGKWQLAVMAGLTVLSVGLGLKIADPSMSIGLILMHSSVMVALQNFGHQIFKQVAVKKD